LAQLQLTSKSIPRNGGTIATNRRYASLTVDFHNRSHSVIDYLRNFFMTNFHEILEDKKALVGAFKSIQISEKQRENLIQLCNTRGGVHTTRDSGMRVRGETVYSSSKVGVALTKHFDGVGPGDKMMWIGTIKQDAKNEERWVMRPQIKDALATMGWV
jgi:hypothetical protein